MENKLIIGGHRGLGQSDSAFFRKVRAAEGGGFPVENTVESIEAVYDAGCDYIEIDAVMSSDGVVFSLHNVVPSDHFFVEPLPPTFLNLMPYHEISRYNPGPEGKGVVTLLADLLDVVARRDPRTCPWAVNLEIKGVQRTPQSYEQNDFIERVASVVRASRIPEERFLLSSFSLDNIVRASYLMPKAQYAMLFNERNDNVPLYRGEGNNMRRNYLLFDEPVVRKILEIWQHDAAPGVRLGYLHPEFDDVTHETVAMARAQGMGINAWEFGRAMSPERKQSYFDMAAYCAEQRVLFSIITDYTRDILR